MRTVKVEELSENPEFSKGARAKYNERTKEVVLTNEATGEEVKLACTGCDNDMFDKGDFLECSSCGKKVEDGY